MNNKFDNNSITDAEIREAFGAELATGQVILIYGKPTGNENFHDLYFAQLGRFNRSSTKISALTAKLKNFNNESFILRHRDTLNLEALAEMGIENPGDGMSGVNIQIIDSEVPAWEGDTPVQSADGEHKLSNGQIFYQGSDLVDEETFAEEGHLVFAIDQVATRRPVAQRAVRRMEGASTLRS